MEPCPYSVGKCDVMRTCPCCRRRFGSRGAEANHQRTCDKPIDVVFAQYQHEHWLNNHDRRTEQARRRTNRR
jgi:hypothetical protein